MTRKAYILLFLIAQSLDLLSTIIGIQNFGMVEQNPILNQFSLLGLSIIKVVAFSVIALYFYIKRKKIPTWYFVVVIIISSIAPVLNFLQMFLRIKGII